WRGGDEPTCQFLQADARGNQRSLLRRRARTGLGLRLPNRGEGGQARTDRGEPGPRRRGGRDPTARPNARSGEGEGTRSARTSAHLRRGSRNRPRDEDRGERSVLV